MVKNEPRELTQEEWRVLSRDLARFYLVACGCCAVLGFMLGLAVAR
jgi:hypothetical protein